MSALSTGLAQAACVVLLVSLCALTPQTLFALRRAGKEEAQMVEAAVQGVCLCLARACRCVRLAFAFACMHLSRVT